MSEKTINQKLLYLTITIYPMVLIYLSAINNPRHFQLYYELIVSFFIFGAVCLLVQILDLVKRGASYAGI
jgi:hypothetical protein